MDGCRVKYLAKRRMESCSCNIYLFRQLVLVCNHYIHVVENME